MAAHRYWRVLIHGSPGVPIFTIGELKASLTLGGANVFTGGTASASSTYTGGGAGVNTPDKAFDNNPATCWGSATQNDGEWLAYDLGAGNSADIKFFTIQARSDDSPSAIAQTPNNFEFQYSDDGAAWTSVKLYTSWQYAIGETRTFTVPISTSNLHRYWRLVIAETAWSGSSVGVIAEFQGFETAAGANKFTGGTSLESGDAGAGFTSPGAFDGNLATQWGVNAGVVGSWLGYDLGAGNSADIKKISLTARNTQPTQTPTAGKIQYSDDGAAWTDYWTFNLPSTTVNSQVVTVDVLPANAPTIQVAQLSILGVEQSPAAPVDIAQLVIIGIVEGPPNSIALTNVIALNCWQPCASYGTFQTVIIYG